MNEHFLKRTSAPAASAGLRLRVCNASMDRVRHKPPSPRPASLYIEVFLRRDPLGGDAALEEASLEVDDELAVADEVEVRRLVNRVTEHGRDRRAHPALRESRGRRRRGAGGDRPRIPATEGMAIR